MNARALWIIGMIGAVAGAFTGDATLPEPWNHYAMLAGVVSAAITGYNVTHPAPECESCKKQLGIGAAVDPPRP